MGSTETLGMSAAGQGMSLLGMKPSRRLYLSGERRKVTVSHRASWPSFGIEQPALVNDPRGWGSGGRPMADAEASVGRM